MILNSPWEFKWPKVEEKTTIEYILRKLSENSTKHQDSVAVRDALSGSSWTYLDIMNLSKRVASGLNKLGLRKGDVIISSSHDPSRIHTFMIGVWRANGIFRASYPEDHGDELVEKIKESNSKFVVCDIAYLKENLQSIGKIPWSVQLIVFGEVPSSGENTNCISADQLFQDDGKECPELDASEKDLCMILSTSGTTGRSKGALYNQETLLRSILAYECMPFTDAPNLPTIVTSRQTHYVGSVVGLAFLTSGKMFMSMNPVTVENILQTVQKYKVRSIVGFPKYLLGLVNDPRAKIYDLSSIVYLSSAGQLVGPEFISTIKKLPNLEFFMTFYGMTESGLLGCPANWDNVRRSKNEILQDVPPFSVGKLPPGTSLKVLDLETGKILSQEEKGELYFRSELTCNGYLGSPTENLTDGWIRTGDVGYFDESGFIFIVDREKEIFKYFNNHISPSELENILLKHEALSEVVCCGVQDPDGGDMIPRAFVVLKKGYEHITPAEIQHYFDSKVPDYKRLRGGLYILDSLPVGKTGKVTRRMMAELMV